MTIQEIEKRIETHRKAKEKEQELMRKPMFSVEDVQKSVSEAIEKYANMTRESMKERIALEVQQNTDRFIKNFTETTFNKITEQINRATEQYEKTLRNYDRIQPYLEDLKQKVDELANWEQVAGILAERISEQNKTLQRLIQLQDKILKILPHLDYAKKSPKFVE